MDHWGSTYRSPASAAARGPAGSRLLTPSSYTAALSGLSRACPHRPRRPTLPAVAGRAPVAACSQCVHPDGKIQAWFTGVLAKLGSVARAKRHREHVDGHAAGILGDSPGRRCERTATLGATRATRRGCTPPLRSTTSTTQRRGPRISNKQIRLNTTQPGNSVSPQPRPADHTSGARSAPQTRTTWSIRLPISPTGATENTPRSAKACTKAK